MLLLYRFVIMLALTRYLAAASYFNIFDRYFSPVDMASYDEVCMLCENAIVDDKVILTAKGLRVFGAIRGIVQ